MVNLQNLLQTAPTKKVSVKGDNAEISLLGGNTAAVENSEFANIMNQEVGTKISGQSVDLLQNTNVNPELIKILSNNGEEITPENIAKLEKLLSKMPNTQLANPQAVEGNKEALVRKLGVSVNKEIKFSPEDIKNLEIVKDQVIAGRKSSSNVQELLNQIKSANIPEEGEEDVIPAQGMPKTQIQIEDTEERREISSPLEFLMNGTKERKANATNFQNGLVKSELKNSSLPQNISAEEFVQLRGNSKAPTEEKQQLTVNKSDDAKLIDLMAMNQQGMKNKSLAQAYGKEQGLLQKNIITKPADLLNKDEKVKAFGNDELKTSEFKTNNEIQSMKNDLLLGSAPLVVGAKELNETHVKTAPTFDMVNIKSNSSEEIIKQVSDYIQQSQLAGKDQIDLTVKHQELGQFKINVTKLQGQNSIDMQITAQSREAHQFFVRHESELARSLTQSGIQLADFKVVASQSDIGASSQSQSKQFYQGSQDQNSSSKQWANFESQQFGDGRERRKELWDEYRSRLSA